MEHFIVKILYFSYDRWDDVKQETNNFVLQYNSSALGFNKSPYCKPCKMSAVEMVSSPVYALSAPLAETRGTAWHRRTAVARGRSNKAARAAAAGRDAESKYSTGRS